MPILVQALSSISRSSTSTSLSRASTGHSATSENESLYSAKICKHHGRITEIAAQPDFYIFTSLLWIRAPDSGVESTGPCKRWHKSAAKEANTSQSTMLKEDEPDLGLLGYHRDRLAAAADALQWQKILALDLSENGLRALRSAITVYTRCLPGLAPGQVERHKLRVMIERTGSVAIDSTIIDRLNLHDYQCFIDTFLPITLDLTVPGNFSIELNGEPIRDDKLCQVCIDTRPLNPSLFTTHKTSHRAPYDAARSRNKITAYPPTIKEVLLYNQNREITEASLCTVYFFKNDQWITPAAICGGNLGVTRRMALESNLCKQGSIDVGELRDGERIWLSNGARGFFVGQICLETDVPGSETKNGTPH